MALHGSLTIRVGLERVSRCEICTLNSLADDLATEIFRRKGGNVEFNDAQNTLYLRLCDI